MQMTESRDLKKRLFSQVTRYILWIQFCYYSGFTTAFRIAKAAKSSKSQLLQEVFALSVSEFKEKGFFVEFGATDGITLSNTYMLETEYNWSGILAEPAKNWHTDLSKNRRCKIDESCVWVESGSEIDFSEAKVGEFSTISDLMSSDHHFHKRQDSNSYMVKTISLNDLLLKHNAPKVIDYMSIDTEGSEYEILNAFNFKSFQINIVTVEHNYSQQREKLVNLFVSNGFIKIRSDLSLWDDWYVNKKFIESSPIKDFLLKKKTETYA